MKPAAFFLTTLIGIVAGGCDSPVPATADRSPFHSVLVRDGVIVATLPATPTWMVIEGASEPRRSKPEESFPIHVGSALELVEHHSSYHVTAQLIPKAGLTIESTFDARSFGGGVTKKKFFVPAK